MGASPELGELFRSLIAWRRAYGFFLTQIASRLGEALEAEAEALPEGAPAPPTMIQCLEIVSQAAAHFAHQPVEMKELAGEPILDAVQVLAKTAKMAELRMAVEAEQRRRKAPVPLGFAWAGDQEPKLERGGKLVLAGWNPALRWLLHARTAGQLDGLTTVVLAAGRTEDSPFAARRGDPDAGDLYLIEEAVWRGCAASRKAFSQFFGGVVMPMTGPQIDLVVCEDLRRLSKVPFGRHPAMAAADDLRFLTHLSSAAGFAFVGCLPADAEDDETIDNRKSAWEHLGLFALVVRVASRRQGQQIVITPGAISDERYVVPKPEFDRWLPPAPEKRIIVPGEIPDTERAP